MDSLELRIQKWNSPEIESELIRIGVSPKIVQLLLPELDTLRLRGQYYQNHVKMNWVSEDDTRSFLVVPLLIASGWDQYRIKLEIHNIDILCFNRPFEAVEDYVETKNINFKNAHLLIEVKKRDTSALQAVKQLKRYTENDFPSCSVACATNGLDYFLYAKNGKCFDFDKNEQFCILEPSIKACKALKLLMP